MARFDEKIYITPEWEEMINGSEFELLTPKGWVSGTFPDVLSLQPELDEFEGDDEMKLAHAITRVKK